MSENSALRSLEKMTRRVQMVTIMIALLWMIITAHAHDLVPQQTLPKQQSSDHAVRSILSTALQERRAQLLRGVGGGDSLNDEDDTNEVARGVAVVNERYLLESPIQAPFLQSSAWTIVPWQTMDKGITPLNENFVLDDRLSRGGCGEVWFARDLRDRSKRFVLKRVFPEKILSGMREVYFGERLRGETRAARFIEAFNRTTSAGEVELWLVFEDEGISLRDFLYESRPDGIVEPSAFWKKLRGTGEKGFVMRREIARQLVIGLYSLGLKKIVHRDIKPGNIFVTVEGGIRGGGAPVKIGDFGSAIDPVSFRRGLFGPIGPTREEHTTLYEPPEFASFSRNLAFVDKTFQPAFDAWSLGVVLLELLLGTDQVFALSDTSKRKSSRARKRSSREVASSPSTGTSTNSEYEERLLEFGIEDLIRFNESVAAIDPFKQGFANEDELKFVFNLLRINPAQRMTFEAAMEHPYLATASGDEGPIVMDSEEEATSPADKISVPAPPGSMLQETSTLSFVCGKCGRHFASFGGCHAHAQARGHYSLRFDPAHPERSLCRADFSKLPKIDHGACSDYTLLSADPRHYWCGTAGGKTYSEDFYAMNEQETVFVVVDGHFGETAGRFAANRLVEEFSSAMQSNPAALLKESASSIFLRVNAEFLEAYPEEDSGTAATVLTLFPSEKVLVVANVGDARVIVCCDKATRPMVLTEDHLASDERERERIQAIPGGFIGYANGRFRLQGKLALTRAIGDRPFLPFVNSYPYVASLNVSEPHFRFVLIGTDGIFDAVSNEDVVSLVWAEMVWSEGVVAVHAQDSSIDESDAPSAWFARAARRVVAEARARGITSDNAGLAVIPLWPMATSSISPSTCTSSPTPP